MKILTFTTILSLLAVFLFGFLLISHNGQNHAAMMDCVAQKIMGLNCVSFDPFSLAGFHLNFLKYFSIALIFFGVLFFTPGLFYFIPAPVVRVFASSGIMPPAQMRLLSWLSFHIASPSWVV